MLTKKTKGGLVILVIYEDDIILTSSDDNGIHVTKLIYNIIPLFVTLGVLDTFLELCLSIRMGSYL